MIFYLAHNAAPDLHRHLPDHASETGTTQRPPQLNEIAVVLKRCDERHRIVDSRRPEANALARSTRAGTPP